jgi:hemerythrin-like domain-containing protein
MGYLGGHAEHESSGAKGMALPTAPSGHAILTLHSAPSAGFDQPFEMLEACHERVERMLGLLERLALHLRDRGCNEEARHAARDVMRYFDQAGPAHHEDEERHVFPLLLSHAAPDLQALAERLQREHLSLTEQWQLVRADLQQVVGGAGLVAGIEAWSPRWAEFSRLYRAHIEAEETQAYPAAMPWADAAAQAAMGQEMAQRRGAR